MKFDRETNDYKCDIDIQLSLGIQVGNIPYWITKHDTSFGIGRRCIYYGSVVLLLMAGIVSTECHLRKII